MNRSFYQSGGLGKNRIKKQEIDSDKNIVILKYILGKKGSIR